MVVVVVVAVVVVVVVVCCCCLQLLFAVVVCCCFLLLLLLLLLVVVVVLLLLLSLLSLLSSSSSSWWWWWWCRVFSPNSFAIGLLLQAEGGFAVFLDSFWGGCRAGCCLRCRLIFDFLLDSVWVGNRVFNTKNQKFYLVLAAALLHKVDRVMLSMRENNFTV